jgi:hypothetical protein
MAKPKIGTFTRRGLKSKKENLANLRLRKILPKDDSASQGGDSAIVVMESESQFKDSFAIEI